MRYVSLDLETTSLRHHPCNILEFAAVIEDTSQSVPVEELPTFHRLISPSNVFDANEVTGSHYALAMNAQLLAELSGYNGAQPRTSIVDLNQLEAEFKAWLAENGLEGTKITLAGKNVGLFDYQFLPYGIKELCAHRMIDVGSVYFTPGGGVRSLDVLLAERGIRDGAAHDALTDARDVIRLMRAKHEE